MATTTMPVPSNAPRLVVAGLMGLLVGATVSGVVTWTVRSAQLTNESAAAPAAVEQLSPEGIRAGFAYAAPAAVEQLSPEGIRAGFAYAAPAAVEQLSPEGIRAGFAYAAPAAVEPFSPERIRVLNG